MIMAVMFMSGCRGGEARDLADPALDAESKK